MTTATQDRPAVRTPTSAEHPVPTPSQVAPRLGTLSRTVARGQVWLVSKDPAKPAVGHENWAGAPAVVVSDTRAANANGVVQVVYTTDSDGKRAGGAHVPVGQLPGGRGSALALCEQVHSVDASRLRRKLTELDAGTMEQVSTAIARGLGLVLS